MRPLRWMWSLSGGTESIHESAWIGLGVPADSSGERQASQGESGSCQERVLGSEGWPIPGIAVAPATSGCCSGSRRIAAPKGDWVGDVREIERSPGQSRTGRVKEARRCGPGMNRVRRSTRDSGNWPPYGWAALPTVTGVYPVFSGPEGLPEGLVVQKPAPSRLRGGLAVRRASVQVGSR